VCLSSIDDVSEREAHAFAHWDKSDVVPKGESPLLQRLFKLMLLHSDKAYVRMIHQLSKVVTRNDFLVKRINQYIDQRHQFIQQVLVVVRSIEQAISDTDESIASTKRQIEMDEVFLATHIQAVEYRKKIVVELSGSLARNKAELQTITERCDEYAAYKDKDSANTSAAVDMATKAVVKAFTQEEQYKLYIQQHPSPEINHLFNTYCVLREFTPRDENDYWPEARVILKSGRFHRTITVFDKNNIKKEVLLQFDVMMNSPMIKEQNFPATSAVRTLAVWIAAVHKHTQSTNFNSTVSQQMLELMKAKSRKEMEIAELEVSVRDAQADLEKHEQSLADLREKIETETRFLENLTLFNDKAKQVGITFPMVKDDLNDFVKGEEAYGENLSGFVLTVLGRCVVLPLLPAHYRAPFMKGIDDILQDSQFDSRFFVAITDIIGSDDPVVLAILSGDKLVTVFDPHDTVYELLGGNRGFILPALAQFDFVHTDPSLTSFRDSVVKAAENGSILVIRHADMVLSNSFLISIASSAVKAAPFYDQITNIDRRFRVVFLIDRPPKKLHPHMTFMHCGIVSTAKLASVLIKDNAPVIAAQKRATAGMTLHTQKENLYLSLQALNDKLTKIHAADTTVLDDVLLQSQLLGTALRGYSDCVDADEHSLDEVPWVRPLATEVLSFIDKLQELYRVSPLYLWPFSKVSEFINESRGQADVMKLLCERVAASMLASHRWGVEQLKTVEPLKFAPRKLNILHYEDLAIATELFLHIDSKAQHHCSVQQDTEFKAAEFTEFLKEGSDVIFAFFEDNLAFALELDQAVSAVEAVDWNDDSRVFILTDTSFEFPSHLICVCQLWAIE
jgi:hypothetical protein